MVVSAVEQTGEVPGFVDRLGERVVVPQPSGAFLEYLHFRHQLSSEPFFESALKARLKRLSNFRNPSYARAARLQREAAHEHRLALVSSYVTGRRLADIIVLARRGKVRPKTSAVLSLTRQLMTAVALLHDYAPDVFHGAIGPERLVVGADGRLVVTEYVLGAAIEEAAGTWGAPALWRDYRIPALADTGLARYGRRLDLVQIGLVTLALLVGRPLTDADYPGGLTAALDLATETGADGEEVPLGSVLRDWLSKLLFLEPASAFRTLLEAQKAFGRMVEEDSRYGVSSVAVESFLTQCEEAAVLPGVTLEREWAAEPPQEPPAALEAREETAVDAAPPEQPASVPEEPPREPAAASTLSAPASPEASEPESDPFWPVVVGSDTIGTLFETFKPTGPVRESHAVSIPETDVVERPSAREQLAAMDHQPAAPPRAGLEPAEAPAAPAVPHQAALSELTPRDGVPVAGWFDQDENAEEARLLRETLFEAPPAAPQPPAAVVPGARAGIDADSLLEPPTVAVPAWAPRYAPPADSRAEVVVIDAPAAPPAPPAAFEERPAAVFVPAEGRPAEQPMAERRVPTVLSYEDVHRPTAAPRSRRGMVGATIGLVVLAIAGGIGFAVWSSRASSGSRPSPSTASKPAATVAPGGARITTQPPGGRITIDGSPRGTAPLELSGLSAGSHLLTAESDWGSVDQELRIEPGKVATVSVTIAGWVKFVAPVELIVSEQGRSYGTTGKGQLMVPSGRHHFDLANQSVAVKLTQFVDVPGGQVTTVRVELPPGTLNLTADQPAEVLLDGQVIGQTPMMSVSTPLGQHEVIFRSDKYGEVSYTVNVTLAAPVRLKVNFLKR